MKMRQLILELYGDKALHRLPADWHWCLDIDYSQMLYNDKASLAYGLGLHGATRDVVWAWDSHIRARSAQYQTPGAGKESLRAQPRRPGGKWGQI